MEHRLVDAVLEISRYVMHGWHLDGDKEMICDFGNLYATRGDFISMRPRNNVNSAMLDVLANALTLDEIALNAGRKNWYLPTHFAQMVLDTKGARTVHDFIKHFKQGKTPYMGNISTVELIFIPINEDSMHWYLCLVKVKESRALVLDSMIGNSKSKREETSLELIQMLDRVLAEKEFDDSLGVALPKYSAFQILTMDVPQQKNIHDCGLHIIRYMRFVMDTSIDLMDKKNDAIHVEPDRREMIKWLVMHQHNKCRDAVINDSICFISSCEYKETAKALRAAKRRSIKLISQI